MLLPSRPTLFLRFSRLSVSVHRFYKPTTSITMDGLRAKISALTPYQKKHKVTVVGSGNW
jgi:hypothetical protein